MAGFGPNDFINGLSGTEGINPASLGIDRRPAREVVEILHREDRRAWDAVGGALDAIALVADRVAEAFRSGGRLIYVGAGTSGRLGVLDASECPPTFSVEPERVVGIIAGGERALRSSVEGAEDSPEDGAEAMRTAGAGPRDVVCGIAASGSTPYVLGALEEARRRGSTTALIACNALPAGAAAPAVDVRIELPVGPEVVSGSTRLKAGTATKMVLNSITTAAMIRWGKVHDNLMVDLRPVNRKLVRRAIRLIEKLAEVDADRAAALLAASGNSVKTAVVMARRQVDAAGARRLLDIHHGILRAALEAP